MQNILINDLSARIQSKRSDIDRALAQVLDSGWLVLGSQVKQFEAEFAEYLGVEHCVTLANGTDAIELGLRALGVRIGDSVATVANAGAYTTTALLAIGARPFFMDVDAGHFNTTLQEVQRAIEAGVKTIVVTHLYGKPVPQIREIAQLCASKQVLLLEDCAQAHGASHDGQRVGSFGNAASFSFYPTKNLGALGDGGAIVTSNPAVADAVRRLRQYGWSNKYHVDTGSARNSRLDELQAAVLRVFLPDLDRSNEQRRRIAQRYQAEMQVKGILLPQLNVGDVAHLYVIRCEQRQKLQAHLKSKGIVSDVHYPIPDHRQAVFGGIYESQKLPVTERLCQEVLTLPCYPEMSDAQVEQVISAVNAWQA